MFSFGVFFFFIAGGVRFWNVCFYEVILGDFFCLLLCFLGGVLDWINNELYGIWENNSSSDE